MTASFHWRSFIFLVIKAVFYISRRSWEFAFRVGKTGSLTVNRDRRVCLPLDEPNHFLLQHALSIHIFKLTILHEHILSSLFLFLYRN